jgi:hypothetical protein
VDPSYGNAYQIYVKALSLATVIYPNGDPDANVDTETILKALASISGLSLEKQREFARLLKGGTVPPEELFKSIMQLKAGIVPQHDFLQSMTQTFQAIQHGQTTTRFGQLMSHAGWVRQFAVTERELMALVPPETREGDTICFFLGGETPFILREAVTDKSEERAKDPSWNLVGEAYVHGFMDGRPMENDKSFKWFNLV